MPNNGRSFGQNIRNRGLKSLERIGRIFLSAEEENRIRHAKFAHAHAGAIVTASRAHPDAYVRISRRPQRRQGVADGGGRRYARQLRLP